MLDFTEIFSDYFVKNLGIPVISVAVTTGVKVISRKDHSIKFTRNDIAIGLNLIIIGIILFFNNVLKLAETLSSLSVPAEQLLCSKKMFNMMCLMLCYTGVAVILSVIIRVYGWEKDDEKELTKGVGIAMPLVIGALLLVYAVNYTNQ